MDLANSNAVLLIFNHLQWPSLKSRTNARLILLFKAVRNSGVASRKAMGGQPAPWYLVIVIKITQKANDPMWASQHTVLYYSLQYTT